VPGALSTFSRYSLAGRARQPSFSPGETGWRFWNSAREGSPAAIRGLIAIVNDEEAPYGAQIAAANAVLERAFGKPKQEVSVENQGRRLEDYLLEIWAAKQTQERAEGDQEG